MPHMNKFIGCGHLGKDPDIRTAQSGSKVSRFSVGISGREKVNGNWEKTTEWVNCVAFGKTAEFMEKYSRKGDLCLFEGRMKTEKYTDAKGVDRWSTQIICDSVQTQSKNGSGQQESQKDEFEDEIPF